MDGGGSLLCWGSGEHGQHGHTWSNPATSGADVSSQDGQLLLHGLDAESAPPGVRAIACGSSHTVVLTGNNELYAWGHGYSASCCCDARQLPGQLPTKLIVPHGASTSSVVGLCCGGRQTLAWLDDGQAFCVDGAVLNSSQSNESCIIQESSETGRHKVTPPILRILAMSAVPLPTSSPVSHVACGDRHALLLLRGGSLYASGSNTYGQLGTGDRIEAYKPAKLDVDPVHLLACGAHHSMVITTDGDLFVWGYGKAVGDRDADVLRPSKKVKHHTNITMIAAGGAHCLALTVNGNVYSWGVGVDGQLGHGEEENFVEMPTKISDQKLVANTAVVSAGDLYSAAITVAGELFMWGKNSHTIDRHRIAAARIYVPTKVDTASRPVKTVACGTWHAACIVGQPDVVDKGSAHDLQSLWGDDSDILDETVADKVDDTLVGHDIQRHAGACVAGNVDQTPYLHRPKSRGTRQQEDRRRYGSESLIFSRPEPLGGNGHVPTPETKHAATVSDTAGKSISSYSDAAATQFSLQVKPNRFDKPRDPRGRDRPTVARAVGAGRPSSLAAANAEPPALGAYVPRRPSSKSVGGSESFADGMWAEEDCDFADRVTAGGGAEATAAYRLGRAGGAGIAHEEAFAATETRPQRPVSGSAGGRGQAPRRGPGASFAMTMRQHDSGPAAPEQGAAAAGGGSLPGTSTSVRHSAKSGRRPEDGGRDSVRSAAGANPAIFTEGGQWTSHETLLPSSPGQTNAAQRWPSHAAQVAGDDTRRNRPPPANRQSYGSAELVADSGSGGDVWSDASYDLRVNYSQQLPGAYAHAIRSRLPPLRKKPHGGSARQVRASLPHEDQSNSSVAEALVEPAMAAAPTGREPIWHAKGDAEGQSGALTAGKLAAGPSSHSPLSPTTVGFINDRTQSEPHQKADSGYRRSVSIPPRDVYYGVASAAATASVSAVQTARRGTVPVQPRRRNAARLLPGIDAAGRGSMQSGSSEHGRSDELLVVSVKSTTATTPARSGGDEAEGQQLSACVRYSVGRGEQLVSADQRS